LAIFLRYFLPFFLVTFRRKICASEYSERVFRFAALLRAALLGGNPVLMMRLLRFKAAFGACGFSLRILGANLCAKGESGDLSGVYGSPGPNSHRCRRKSAAFATLLPFLSAPAPENLLLERASPPSVTLQLQATTPSPSSDEQPQPGKDAGFAV
jgi:hypothetical protein